MALFRVESVLDQNTGFYYIELYTPHDSETPMVRSAAIYSSIDHAEVAAIEILKTAMPEQPIKVIGRE